MVAVQPRLAVRLPTSSLVPNSLHFFSTTAEARGQRRWGRVTVPEGARYAIWNPMSGTCRQIDGPGALWASGARVEELKLHTAEPSQYLVVTRKDGTVEHRRGPCSQWADPVNYVSVATHTSLNVEGGEAIVVYREESGAGDTKELRRIIMRGPLLHVPTGLEWLHNFSWHGTSVKTFKEELQVKLPGALKFQKLRTTPDQVYFDIPSVRTRDDALITIKLMAFVQVMDIEKMLDATHDPISEFMSSLSADTMDFVGMRSFDKFKADLESLSSLESYPHFAARCKMVGYDLSKVVFRGYTTSPQLQEMHDAAIHKRTELVLQRETQEQEQDLKDFQLMRDSARAQQLSDFELQRAREQQALQTQSREHDVRMLDMAAVASRKRDYDEHLQSLKVKEESHTLEIKHTNNDNRTAQEHYTKLQHMGVDLSRYLTVLARGPAQRVIEVDAGGKGFGTCAAQLHIHSEDGKGEYLA